ncbi:MAG: hypothetical protein N2316_11690 [Spirochaetes bacterium]|nr:hypothetical protein [Spirochaetota bacterium]
MNNGNSSQLMIIGILLMAFVIVYVWQNISMMKLRMECKRAIEKERELYKEHDMLLYEIEKRRKIDVVEGIAQKKGMKRIAPHDVMRIIGGDMQ